MSIIEEAFRKTAQHHHQRPPAPDREAVLSAARRPRQSSAPVDATQALRFRPVTLDPQILQDNNVLSELADAAALRAYKILRTRVLRRLEAQQWNSLAITGVTPGEGKTLTAINLAMALAQEQNTWVFLVDLDLQRPSVASYLGLSGLHGEQGLSDYLQGDATIENITYRLDIGRLAVIPNFTATANSSELLTSPRMQQFVQTLEAEMPRRIIIFDMPPVLAADDVMAFAPQVDSFLLVVAEGKTGRDALRGAKEVLAEMNLLGVVLNRSADRGSESAYYYLGPRKE